MVGDNDGYFSSAYVMYGFAASPFHMQKVVCIGLYAVDVWVLRPGGNIIDQFTGDRYFGFGGFTQ